MARPVANADTMPPSIQLTRFGPLTIAFDQRVLHPRPWTVMHSAWAAQLLTGLPAGPVLELCSGAGHIGLLAVAGTGRRLVMVDASAAACRYARINADHAGARDSVEIRQGRMEEVLAPDERFGLIIADPPWVPSRDTARHPDDPVLAIDGGPDGLDLARSALTVIGRHLLADGAAVLQVGRDQVHAVVAHLDEHPELDLRAVDRRLAQRGALVHLARRRAR